MPRHVIRIAAEVGAIDEALPVAFNLVTKASCGPAVVVWKTPVVVGKLLESAAADVGIAGSVHRDAAADVTDATVGVPLPPK